MVSVKGDRVFIEADLTVETVPNVDRALQALPLRAGCVLNCKQVKAVDSAAIALLLSWRKQIGEAFQVEGLPPALLALAELYQVAEWLGILSSENRTK